MLRLALALALLFPAVAAADGADDLTVTRSDQLSPRLREFGFTTPALSGETNVRILLPAGYDAHPNRRYPVLYLLHGCCDFDVPGSRAWTTHGEAEEATAGLPLIVVMPDGGRGGFYSDWYNNGLGGTPMWETYHLGELMPWVDREFRTRAEREGRVIAGLSMGGFGAMKYAAEHPDRFVAAATFSGAVDTNQIAAELDALSGLDGGVPGSVFGMRDLEEVRWRSANPWDLAENLRGLQLTLRTGNGQPGPYDDPSSGPDALESSVHDQTVALHEKLATLGIAHTFDDYGPGHHAWPYWARDLKQTLPDLMAQLKHPPAPPRRVTYATAAPEYDVYGWHVKVTRPGLEFSRLSGASRRGFTLEGSGDAEVTTPPVYAGGEVKVGDGPAQTLHGPRLHVAVPLGPGNQGQQYRAGVTTQVNKTTVSITPCLTRHAVTVRLPRRVTHAHVNGKRVRARHRRLRVRLTPGSTTRVRFAGRTRRFRACA
ncbi:MAG: hypothetical protein QOI80_1326 [Solirubrobacteraceae bacterium]|nr:hypothetical protein [Solirubrobacteraceae bacterium]